MAISSHTHTWCGSQCPGACSTSWWWLRPSSSWSWCELGPILVDPWWKSSLFSCPEGQALPTLSRLRQTSGRNCLFSEPLWLTSIPLLSSVILLLVHLASPFLFNFNPCLAFTNFLPNALVSVPESYLYSSTTGLLSNLWPLVSAPHLPAETAHSFSFTTAWSVNSHTHVP